MLEKRDSGVDPHIESLAELVIGAAIEVHRILGPGLPESAYERALSYELNFRSVSHVCQSPFPIHYKEVVVGDGRIDLLVDKLLVVELKCVETLATVHRAQVISYLQATRLDLGLLINFNVPVLKDGIRRVLRGGSGLAPRLHS